MPDNEKYLPGSDMELDAKAKFFCQLLTERTSGASPEWDHIPQAAVDLFLAIYAAWYLAFSKTQKPHTPQDTAEKNRARKALKKEMRSFTNEFIRYSSKVSESDRESLGVFGRQPPHPVQAPTTVPALEPRAGNPREVVEALAGAKTLRVFIPLGAPAGGENPQGFHPFVGFHVITGRSPEGGQRAVMRRLCAPCMATPSGAQRRRMAACCPPRTMPDYR
jgi:hypothetical protein